VQRYLEKISGPLLDRIDLIVEVPRIAHHDLRSATAKGDVSKVGISESDTVRRRVMQCRILQKERCGKLNSDLGNPDIEAICELDASSERLLALAVDKLRLSARGCHRILKIARTIADLEQRSVIHERDLTEAIAYRRMERYFNQGAMLDSAGG